MNLDNYKVLKEIVEHSDNGKRVIYYIMEKKKDWLNFFQKTVIMLGVLLISASAVYYFVYKPIQKQKNIKQCDEQTGWSNNTRLQDKWQTEYEKCLRERGV